MDSYFKNKLAQAQAKLQSAAKYIPKDIMKNIPGRKKNQQDAESLGDQDVGEQFVDVEGIQDFQHPETIKKRGILSGIKGKIQEVKKNYWKPQQIDEKFIQATEEVVLEKEVIVVNMPKPEEACNQTIKRMLSSKYIENQSSMKIKDQTAKIIDALNKKEINLKAL